MEVALMLLLAIVAVSVLGIWTYALWRGWLHASQDFTRSERRLALSGLAAVLLFPVALAFLGASDATTNIAIAVGMAGILPLLLGIGVRDYRRREKRIQAPSRQFAR